MPKWWPLALAILCFAGPTILAVLAGDAVRHAGSKGKWLEPSSAYEEAREAVARGDALPLAEIRKRLGQIAPGRIVSTEYEYEFDRWVYEFKIVDERGELKKVHLDARDGELVKVSDY